MHARRGGRGRHGGKLDRADIAVADQPQPQRQPPRGTAAAEATLAVQHASTADELLQVAHTNRDVLRPGILAQAFLRIAKVEDIP